MAKSGLEKRIQVMTFSARVWSEHQVSHIIKIQQQSSERRETPGVQK